MKHLNPKTLPIGTIIDQRPDGSCIYRSHKGVLNLDNARELAHEQYEDNQYLTYERS